MNPGGLLAGVIFALVGVIILSTTSWDVQETQTYLTYEPYTYEQGFVRENQIRKFIFPWFADVTQAQFTVTNTDAKSGSFTLNFVFDNGKDIKTRAQTITISAGEKKAVTIDSPLKNISEITLKVIPPSKAIPQQRIVTKKANFWDYAGRVVFNIK